ncbi:MULTISPECIES: tRNA-uridine aminocarboxypropyltransferase [Vibrio]|uniref:tRNA-uridine aminocarboxypropyltransferase n=1 Tax=Vibrio chanodichtyis TaxID=3027932 RepID=A0ABT5UXG6_9VIBR|nr:MULTISPECIES: tRNA-uridine aminocarboxypropyltransferase [Vibrio]MDE1514119.1 DTW domain-containing protein [Vibrio chanodichtyis]
MRIHAFHHLYQYRLARSTKPFLARGGKIKRCAYCMVEVSHCLCAHQPEIDSQIAVLLIVSENEVFKPSNTGRLIADTIKATHVYQWSRTEPDPQMLALIADPQYYPVLIFPAETEQDKSRVLNPIPSDFAGKQPLLVLIDGSWREAKRIFRKSPYLAQLPLVSVEPERLSRYMMRKSDNEQHLATAEVASLVLSMFGEHSAATTLELWFEAVKETYLMCKTRNKPNHAKPALQTWIAHQQTTNHR